MSREKEIAGRKAGLMILPEWRNREEWHAWKSARDCGKG